MDKLVYVFENVLTSNFIKLGGKHTYLRIVLRIFTENLLLCKHSLKEIVLIFQVFQKLINFLAIFNRLLVEKLLQCWLKVDKSTIQTFELEHSSHYGLLGICNFVSQLLSPFGQ